MATLSTLLEGMQILNKYMGKVEGECAAEHDIIYLPGPSKEELSAEDAKRLDDLGFFFDDQYDSWARFT